MQKPWRSYSKRWSWRWKGDLARFVAVAGLIILFVVLAKKGAAAGTAVTSTAAANETSHVNLQNANSSNQNTAQVNYESSLKHL